MRSKFKPIYIPMILTGIVLAIALASGVFVFSDLVRSSMENYHSLHSFLIVLLLLIFPLTLVLMVGAGLAYLGIIIGIWVFYGLCVLLVRFVKKQFILLMARKPQPTESVGDESPNGLSAGFTIIFTLGLFFALRLNVLVDSLNISSSSCCHKIALSPQRTSP